MQKQGTAWELFPLHTFLFKEVNYLYLVFVVKTNHKKLLQYNEHYAATYLIQFPTTFAVKCRNNFANQYMVTEGNHGFMNILSQLVNKRRNN